MNGGPELDELICIKVFGKTKGEVGWLPSYSAEPNSLKLVWEEMQGKSAEIRQKFIDEMPSFVAQPVVYGAKSKFAWEFVPPEEMCVAALRALGVNELENM